MIRIYAAVILFFTCLDCVNGQIVDAQEEEEASFYAETKQINQFFRRFNGEEDTRGNRYYEQDKNYRDRRLRKKYLEQLFDLRNTDLSQSLKNEFIEDITEKSSPDFLNFHGGNWFAEVHAVFNFKGDELPGILFLKLQEEEVGSKWVIMSMFFNDFNRHFQKKDGEKEKFLHPMSHELEFMNLRKVFNEENLKPFLPDKYKPDHLSVFLYEYQKGSIKFKTVKDVKFHFFQLGNWYFEISRYIRPGFNRGWLISNLVKINNKQDHELLKKYILLEK